MSKHCQWLACVNSSTAISVRPSRPLTDVGMEQSPPHGGVRAQLDAEPRANATVGAPPSLATPNLAFNKLATMLTHLISRVRHLQAEVNALASPSHDSRRLLICNHNAMWPFASPGCHAESAQCPVH